MLPRRALALASLLFAPLAAPPSAQTPPSLSAATPFVVLGQSADFTVRGTPGAAFWLLWAARPAELGVPGLGTLFLHPAGLFAVAAGTLDGSGSARVQIPLAGAGLAGLVLYAQALTAAATNGLSNAVAFRLQLAAPSGARAPRAFAITPDGTKAYVAHQLDGTVTAVDLVAAAVRADLPIGVPARALPHHPLDVAVDPEGRHAFIANAAAEALAVIDVATDSVAALLAVPKGCHRIAFAFGAQKRIYVTNQVTNAVLVFEEQPPGVFTALPPLPVQGDDPEALAVLPDGRLMVGNRATLEVEVLDPAAAPGSTTVARTNIGSPPFDLVVSGGEVLVPTFVESSSGLDGFNLVRRIGLATFQNAGSLFVNVGTDYTDLAAAGAHLAVVGAGSGSVIVADASTRAVRAVVDAVPGGPAGTPAAAEFATPAALWVLDQFRETLRVIDLGAGPPFAVGAELSLAWSGAPRVPLSGALTAAEEGERWFRSVAFFNGGPSLPNPVTCQTCHIDGATHHVTVFRQSPPLFGLAQTAPYGSQGLAPTLLPVIQNAFARHGMVGGALPAGADQSMLAFLDDFAPPASPYLGPGGALSADAQAGKMLFETAAQCAGCHAAPVFVPLSPLLRTLPNGVGTGLAPINVPSLRGVWATAPYLHDGSRASLRDVLTANPSDVHGALTQTLTAQQIDWIVAYLQTL